MEPTTAKMDTSATKVDTTATNMQTSTAKVDTPTAKMNTSTAAAEMNSATTPAEMRPTPSATTAVSTSATPAVAASATTAPPSHRVDRAGEGHDGCQEECSEFELRDVPWRSPSREGRLDRRTGRGDPSCRYELLLLLAFGIGLGRSLVRRLGLFSGLCRLLLCIRNIVAAVLLCGGAMRCCSLIVLLGGLFVHVCGHDFVLIV